MVDEFEFVPGPILMGKKNTPLDWTAFNERCKERLGYIPEPGRLSNAELRILGFSAAALWGRGQTGKGKGFKPPDL